MLVQLAGLPTAFAALYQAHDISPTWRVHCWA
jgi:hypothetical protein